MYKIVIYGPVASGKTALANTLLGNSTDTYFPNGDKAFIQTEHSSELLDTGVEIIEIPSLINTHNRQFICESIYDADLIICCINLNHFHTQDSEDFIREMLYQVRKSDSITLFAVTHCYMDDRDVKVGRWKEIRAQISSELHSLYSHFDDSQLFMIDLGQYSTKMGSSNAEIIDDNRVLNLKVAIWRQIAMTYYRRIGNH